MTSQIGNYINIQEIDHVYRMGIVADRYCKTLINSSSSGASD